MSKDAAAYDPTALREVLDTLAVLLRCFGAARDHVVVVGGLAPPLLVLTPPGTAHVGTTDIDLCISVALAEGETGYYDEVYQALDQAGFVQQYDDPLRRWRWKRNGIKVEFFYPVAESERPLLTIRHGDEWESAAMKSLGERFEALALGYPALVNADREMVTFEATVDGATTSETAFVTGPFALCALKSAALGSRTKWKDAYDVVWTLGEGDGFDGERLKTLITGSPESAAELRTAVELLADQFRAGRQGPVWYRRFLEPVSEAPGDQLERFAEETVTRWVAEVRAALQSMEDPGPEGGAAGEPASDAGSPAG